MKLATLTALFVLCFLSRLPLPVAGKPLQPGSPGEVLVAAGKDGYLPCLTKASAVTTREWSRVDGSSLSTVCVFRDGKVLEKETSAEYRGRVEQTEDGTLKLGKVTHRDSGTYRCYALGESSEEAFVSLVVAQVSEILLNVGSSSNELLVRCECSGWGPKPQMSLLDAEDKDLQAETSSSDGADDFYTIRTHMDLTAVKSQLLTCRVEIPEMSLVKEKTIKISASEGSQFIFADLTDQSSRPGAAMSHAWVTGIIILAGVAVVGFLVAVWKIGGVQQMRVFRDIPKEKTRGASKDTAKAHRGLDYDQPLDGVRVSEALAGRDLVMMNNYKEIINSVGTLKHVHPGLIAAIISRQSEAGAALNKNSGYGRRDPNCFGLMQINKMFHPSCDRVGPYSKEHVEEGTEFVITLIEKMERERKSWSPDQQLIGALACYIAGDATVLGLKEGEDVDSVTPYKDFANDVVARAQWFAGKGYTPKDLMDPEELITVMLCSTLKLHHLSDDDITTQPITAEVDEMPRPCSSSSDQ
ncbi:hypothetical protein INR49_006924 [Caranx melampygus]|nr:hypothetical protein INR49_006924 [Caranx melampygus]